MEKCEISLKGDCWYDCCRRDSVDETNNWIIRLIYLKGDFEGIVTTVDGDKKMNEYYCWWNC